MFRKEHWQVVYRPILTHRNALRETAVIHYTAAPANFRVASAFGWHKLGGFAIGSDWP